MDDLREVCSVGTGEYYSRCLVRLRESAVKFKQTLTTYTTFPDTYHEDVPYKFKVDALRLATRPARLWLDSPCYFIRDPESLWQQLERDGYLMLDSGYTVGPWSSDRSLDYFGAKRDDVFDLPMPMGACWGYDLRRPDGHIFAEFMRCCAEARNPFLGSLWNRGNSESADPRVKGHRMDMVIMAFLARNQGLKITKTPHFWACDPGDVTSDTVVYSEGLDS